jgi:hypothetical protein
MKSEIQATHCHCISIESTTGGDLLTLGVLIGVPYGVDAGVGLREEDGCLIVVKRRGKR